MDKARKLAGDLLLKITKEGAYSGAELDQALFSGSLNDQDKGFVTELVYGSLARLYSIDEIIKAYSNINLSVKKLESQCKMAITVAIPCTFCFIDFSIFIVFLLWCVIFHKGI